MEEETYTPQTPQKNQRLALITDNCEPVLFDEMEMPEYIRSSTGIGELDRVLGDGIVDGSVVLLAGEPGIGKSTLLMQICSKIPLRILYVSGDESKGQLKLRGQRLGIDGEETYFMTETNVDKILESTDKLKPRIVIIDSIQTMIDPACASIPGSINQVKECATKLIAKAIALDVVDVQDAIAVVSTFGVTQDELDAACIELEAAINAIE